MSGPSIRVHVSTRAAILAGKARIGAQLIEITDTTLAGLSEPQRLEIALLLEGAPELGTLASDPTINEPSIEAVIPVLDARAAGRKAADEVKRVQDARAAEAVVATARDVTSKDNQRAKTLRDWVNKHGDDEQKARMAEGFMREDEILDDVMDEMFEIPFPRYERLRRGDACDCACAGQVVFIERGPLYMDNAQFARLTTARENAPAGASVEPVEHKAACPGCRCVPIARITARVSLPWGGWRLVRDFSLD